MVGQTHHDSFASLCPVLLQGRRLSGLCDKGLIVFGGWLRSPSADLSQAAPVPEELLDLLRRYAFYDHTFDLRDRVSAAKDDAERKPHLKAYYDWIEARPGAFGSAVCDRPWDFKLLEDTLVEKMAHILSLIRGFLFNMDHHCFVFFPDPANPASGWKDFFAFYDLYRRLPDTTIDQFGPYYFIVQLPSP